MCLLILRKYYRITVIILRRYENIIAVESVVVYYYNTISEKKLIGIVSNIKSAFRTGCCLIHTYGKVQPRSLLCEGSKINTY